MSSSSISVPGIVAVTSAGSLCHLNEAAKGWLILPEAPAEADPWASAAGLRLAGDREASSLSDLVADVLASGPHEYRVSVPGDGAAVTVMAAPGTGPDGTAVVTFTAVGAERSRNVRVENLLNSLPESTVAVDADGKIIAVSDSWTDFARDNGAVVSRIGEGTNYLDACRSDADGGLLGAQEAQAGIRAVLNGESDAFTMEYPCHSQAEKRWFRMRVVPLKRPEGGAVIGHLNVTEEKNNQERLRLMEAAVDHAADSVIITEAEPLDEPGPRIVYVNEAVTHHTGYEEEELIGETPRVLQGEDTSRESLDRIREALEEWEPVRETVLNYQKDGTPFWNEIFLAPIADKHGWYTHWVSVQRDVTDQRETAQILARQSAYLGGIIDSAMDAIVTIDADHRIRVFNPAAEAMFGYSAEDVTGEPLGLLLPEQARDAHTEHIRRFGETGISSRYMGDLDRVQGRRRDGSIFPVEASIAQIRVGDEQLFVAILRDVTGRERRRRELEAAKAEAEEANRLKSVLLANMNHEVRTPLTSITGFAEILQQDLPAPHDDHARMIFDSSRRLMRTLDAVMQFSELEAGTEALRYESFDLRDEARAAVALVRETPKDGTIRINAQLPAGPVPVYIGRVAVRRILHHLTENAVKFSPSAATATITLEAEERVVHVEVQDEGIGIPDEAQNRIFEPFIQESEGLQREYEGTGLGLAIVQRLVIALGGMLSIDSTPGAGTTVRLTLPRTPDDRGEVARHVPTRGHVVIAPSREADHFDEVVRG